jgi:hypothetical protein
MPSGYRIKLISLFILTLRNPIGAGGVVRPETQMMTMMRVQTKTMMRKMKTKTRWTLMKIEMLRRARRVTVVSRLIDESVLVAERVRVRGLVISLFVSSGLLADENLQEAIKAQTKSERRSGRRREAQSSDEE